MVVELWPERTCQGPGEERELSRELLEWVQADPLTSLVERVLLHPALPVDIRHNAKIFREKLSTWAAAEI